MKLKKLLNEIKSSFKIELKHSYDIGDIQSVINNLEEYEIFTISKGDKWFSFSFENIQAEEDKIIFSNPSVYDENEKIVAKNISSITRTFGITLDEIQKFVKTTIKESGGDISFVQKEFKLAKLG
jgi:HD superfamily phosphodiesterase